MGSTQVPGEIAILGGFAGQGFAVQQKYTVGLKPRSVVTADFNGDDLPDIAVVNQGIDSERANAEPGSVTVLLNNGNGGFVFGSTMVAGEQSIHGAVGHLNADDLPDIAVANHQGENISVFVGKADGTFEPARPTPNAGKITSVDIVDIDRDGDGDLVASRAQTAPAALSIVLLRNRGDGTFLEPENPIEGVALLAGSANFSVTSGNFNDDDLPDLVVARSSGDLEFIFNELAVIRTAKVQQDRPTPDVNFALFVPTAPVERDIELAIESPLETADRRPPLRARFAMKTVMWIRDHRGGSHWWCDLRGPCQ